MQRLTRSMPGLLGAGALCLGLVHSAPLRAADESADGLDEVVVTAEKWKANLQKTPMSIQVYTGEQLQQEGKKRIDDIMRGVAGVQPSDSQVGSYFSIRGVDNGANGGPVMGPPAPTVAIVIDGVFQNRSEVVRGGTLDVAQVEVMRGTQTTAIGANALAGAVSMVSRRPVFDYQAEGSLEIGNYNLLNMEGVLNLPLADNQALRAAYSTNKRDGYLSSNAGNSDITNARLKYRWQASDTLDIVVTGASNHIGGNGVQQGVLTYSGRWEGYNAANAASYLTTMGGPAGNLLFGLLPTPGQTFRDRSDPWDDGYPADQWPINPFRDTRISQYSAEINWNTAIGDVTLMPSVQNAHFRSTEPPRGSGTSYMAEDIKEDTTQIEARLASRPGARLEWLVGGYFYDLDRPQGVFESIAFANDPMNPTGATTYGWTNSPTKNRTEAAFAQGKYPILDTLRAFASLRYSHDTSDALPTLSGPDGIAGTATGPTGGYVYGSWIKGSWSATTYRSGVEYDVLPQAMVYATYATGYQPGTADAMANRATVKSTTRQYSLGVKSRFLENRLQVNLDAFLLKYKDRPFTSSLMVGSYNFGFPPPTGSPLVAPDYSAMDPNAIVTVPSQESVGADLDITFMPTANDRVDLALEYLDATLSAAPEAPLFSVDQVTAAAVSLGGAVNTVAAQALIDQYATLASSYNGTTLQNAPKLSGNLTYQHRFNLPGGSSLAPSINLVYKDKYWTQSGASPPGGSVDVRHALDDGSVFRQDAYTLWNAYVHWTSADGKFTLSGYMKNIADEVVMTNIGGEPGTPLMYVSLDAPRTFGFAIRASL
ncbi:MAG: TonB-dependent receptor [Gammaproteobacteria bacterium]|nr:TonB-dependent receptor [Gammaproteobacteria bacterium]